MPAALLALLLLAPPVLIDGVDVAGMTPHELWTKSDGYFHEGEYLKSVHILRRVVELDPGDVEAYGVAAWLVWSLGDEPAARKWLNEAVRVNPNDPDAHAELGIHLLERVGEPVLALASLRRAYALPDYPATLPRTLAHCMLEAEVPSEAVALWRTIEQKQQAPPAVAQNNRRRALSAALHSDLLARNGGVFEGSADPAQSPTVVRDLRTDLNADHLPMRRTLELGAPGGGTQVLARITYGARYWAKKPTWHWLTMTGDANGNGRLDDGDPVLLDGDADGIAEGVPPLAKLRAERAASRPAWLQRIVSPDRYELEIGSDGWYRPTLAQDAADGVELRPAATIASDATTLTLRAVARETTKIHDTALPSQPLPAGTYTVNEVGGPDVTVSLTAAQLPPGRYAVALDLLRDGCVVDHKVSPAWIVESDGKRVHVVKALPAEAGVWDHADPSDVPQPGAASPPGLPSAGPMPAPGAVRPPGAGVPPRPGAVPRPGGLPNHP